MIMNKQNLSTFPADRGFVLVTSLVFLVVVTLLAVSAINSSTIQESMASNLREKARARQAADAAVRQGELLLDNAAFDSYQAPGSTVVLSDLGAQGGEDAPDSLKLWVLRSMFSDDQASGSATDDEDSAAFLAQATWDNEDANVYTLPDQVTAQYYVEDYKCLPRDLNPDTCATGDGGVVYRITGRATGRNPAAVAVTQSLYEKNY